MDVLVQQASQAYAGLLRLSEGRHRAYAEQHKMRYMRYDGPQGMEGWPPTWHGWVCCLRLLQAGTDWLFWLDADALIVLDEDLRGALGEDAPQGRMGMVRHPGPPEHWNTGVMYIRNSARMQAFFMEVLKRGPGRWPWYQQEIANELLGEAAWRDLVVRIEDRWNSTFGVNWAAEPAVVAWHGVPAGQKLREMEAYVEWR